MAVKTKIIDHGWEEIEDNIKALDNSYTVVGYIASNSSQDVVNKAVWNELGTSKIPPRPFQRRAFDSNKKMLRALLEQYGNLIMMNKISIRKGLSSIGEIHVRNIKKKIRHGSFKRLADATIKKKKSSKPLFDTGEMINSTTHKEFIK